MLVRVMVKGGCVNVAGLIRGPFTPRIITIKTLKKKTILTSAPLYNNVMFIISAQCSFVVYCFKCSSSLKSKRILIGCLIYIYNIK